MTESSEWSRRVYERHLDLLLAEELECRPSFAGWLLNRGVLHGRPPKADPVNCVVTISNVDAMIEPERTRTIRARTAESFVNLQESRMIPPSARLAGQTFVTTTPRGSRSRSQSATGVG